MGSASSGWALRVRCGSAVKPHLVGDPGKDEEQHVGEAERHGGGCQTVLHIVRPPAIFATKGKGSRAQSEHGEQQIALQQRTSRCLASDLFAKERPMSPVATSQRLKIAYTRRQEPCVEGVSELVRQPVKERALGTSRIPDCAIASCGEESSGGEHAEETCGRPVPHTTPPLPSEEGYRDRWKERLYAGGP
jgi:hypothetical protein